VVGKTFGPVMTLWFGTIAVLGIIHLRDYPEIFKALNPYYGIHLLTTYPKGFLILGGVFLCTTGAEALYSDLGHCGKMNIRVSWLFVKTSLLLSYFGQAAYLLKNHQGSVWSKDLSLFYALAPKEFVPFVIIIASCAAIIASQALITGSFTLINEAIKLRLMPLLKVNYPTQLKGQIYIPFVNWLLLSGCILVVLIFKESSNMEAAYGLTITVDMLMTTTLMVLFYYFHKVRILYVILFGIIFYIIEGAFLLSNIDKFYHGGWFSFCIAAFFIAVMYVLHRARALRDKHIAFVNVNTYKDKILALSNDETIAKEATNLVFMSMSGDKEMLDNNIIYSIFRKKPKRADVYWFVHMEILDEPYEKNYSVDAIIPQKCFFVTIRFGFKVEHMINLIMNHIIKEMVEKGEVDDITRYPSLRPFNMPGDFKYILINSRVSVDDKITPFDQFIIRAYRLIKSISLPPEKDFGLEVSNVVVETVPINIGMRPQDLINGLHRI
jgi:KUP system potassium uptake protein